MENTGNVIIIGARADGHAKVVLEILQTVNKYQVVGFVDDKLYSKKHNIRGIPVIGTTDQLVKLKKEYNLVGGIVAIGDNPTRRQLGDKIKNAKLILINAIHPSVHFDSDVELGEGNYIGQGVIIITGTKIGNHVNIHTAASIDHDNIINDGANLSPGVHTAGRVIIGKDAFLGTGAKVIPDSKIGEGSVIGAGGVVIKNIEPYCLYVGVPAEFKKKLR
ncbi:acetyltransferase [Bacteroidota bacterium]